MKLADIEPNPTQPRKDFPEEGIKELAENIKATKGLLQPLIVRPLPTGGKYQLVDGERRYRACKLIPLEEVPVDVREDIKTDEDAAIQSYIMNEQRLNYNPLDKEAYIYHLYKSTGLSTRKLAAKLGVHHSHIDHLKAAYEFRQRLPPTLVGTLSLTHTNLRETSMIKDDKLRIRFIKMIADKKIRADAVRDVYRVLEKIPAEREEVFEAYAQGMLTLNQIQSLLEGKAELGRDILTNPQRNVSRFFTGEIPLKVKQRLLGLLLLESQEKPEILSTARHYNKALRKHIAEARPDQKPEDIRSFHKLQIYDFAQEIHNFYQAHSIEPIEREFNTEDKRKIWTAIQWWLSVRYEYRDKIRNIESEELAIAVIDLVTEVFHWEAFERSMDKYEEKRKEWMKGGVEG